MKKFRSLTILIVSFCLLMLVPDSAVAQIEKLDYQPGDKIEIEFHNEWFEAKVTEIMPGGFALRADFVDGRGRSTSFVFTAHSIRDLKPANELPPATESTPAEVFPAEKVDVRKWNSADGQFSVEAKLVSKIGDEIKLLKSDGLTISVGLSVLSPADVHYVDVVIRSNTPPDNEDPFVETHEESPYKETNDNPDVESNSDSVEDPFGAFGNPRKSPPAPTQPKTRPDRNAESKKAANPTPKIPTPKIANDKPDAVKPVQTSSRAPWRWIAFGTLFSTGSAMFIWGFLNRNRYW